MENGTSETELLSEFKGVLDEIARNRLTSKNAYARLLQAMFDSKGLIATTTMLTRVIGDYNEQFTLDSNLRIPLGTASAVREAHALFMKQIGTLNKGRLPLDSLSPGLGQKVANLFDEIVGEISAPIFKKAETQFELALANATSAFQTASEAWTAERTGYLSELEASRSEIQQWQTAANAASERAATLLSQLDGLRRQLNATETSEAIAKARLKDAENALNKAEVKIAELTISERDERRVRLQLLDTSRQQALKVQSLEAELLTTRDTLGAKEGDLRALQKRYEDLSAQLPLLKKKADANLLPVSSLTKPVKTKARVRTGLVGAMRRSKQAR